MSTRYADGGITPRTNAHAAVEMLDFAMPTIVLERFAKAYQMPKNKTQQIIFRRARIFDAATTPLLEGVTPNLTQFGYENVPGTMRQYGQVVEITDIIVDFAEDQVAKDAYQQCGENIGRTMEALDWGVLRAGTNVFYTNGTQRTDVNSVLTLGRQQAVTRSLQTNKAKKVTRMLSSSQNFGTSAIQGAYVALSHTDLDSDIRKMPGFVPCEKYGQKQMLLPQEIGSVEHCRYILSEDLEPYIDAGGTAATNGTKTTSGTSSDVYPILYVGQDAYGRVNMRGAGAIKPSIVPVDQATKDDPLAQRGYIGWKGYHLCMILNQLWMARMESAVSAL